MALKNRFNRKRLRYYWGDNIHCYHCNKVGADAFHHVISPSSRRFKKGKFNSSILNACPIHNQGCHLYNSEIHKKEIEKKFLRKILRHLALDNFQPNDKDKDFFEVYKDLY